MIGGISLWICIVFASSWIPSNVRPPSFFRPRHLQMFWLFLVLRGMVGIGEASYAIISPSVIADLYTGLSRSRMLMFFYFATPVGRSAPYLVRYLFQWPRLHCRLGNGHSDWQLEVGSQGDDHLR